MMCNYTASPSSFLKRRHVVAVAKKETVGRRRGLVLKWKPWEVLRHPSSGCTVHHHHYKNDSFFTFSSRHPHGRVMKNCGHDICSNRGNILQFPPHVVSFGRQRLGGLHHTDVIRLFCFSHMYIIYTGIYLIFDF